MKSLPYILAGIGVGLGVYVALTNPNLRNAIGIDDIERAARKTFGWGAGQRLAGAGGQAIGKIKEGLGRISGDGDLAGAGFADQISGTAKVAVGSMAQTAARTVHDLNR